MGVPSRGPTHTQRPLHPVPRSHASLPARHRSRFALSAGAPSAESPTGPKVWHLLPAWPTLDSTQLKTDSKLPYTLNPKPYRVAIGNSHSDLTNAQHLRKPS